MRFVPKVPIFHFLTDCPVDNKNDGIRGFFSEKWKISSGATCLRVCKTVHVLFEIFECLGGVAPRPKNLKEKTTDSSLFPAVPQKMADRSLSGDQPGAMNVAGTPGSAGSMGGASP